MAKFLKLDRKQFSPTTGLLPLYRGDTWNLEGKVVERYAGYETEVDLTGVDVSANFEGPTGSTITTEVTVVDAACGKVAIAVEPADTELVEESEDGAQMYLILTDGDGDEETVPTPDQPLQVRDRGFYQD